MLPDIISRSRLDDMHTNAIQLFWKAERLALGVTIGVLSLLGFSMASMYAVSPIGMALSERHWAMALLAIMAMAAMMLLAAALAARAEDAHLKKLTQYKGIGDRRHRLRHKLEGKNLTDRMWRNFYCGFPFLGFFLLMVAGLSWQANVLLLLAMAASAVAGYMLATEQLSTELQVEGYFDPK